MARSDWTALTDDQLLAQCEVDTYRASGPGGQKRNKTSSAVRLRHPPSGLLVIAEAFRAGLRLEEIQRLSRFDPWFLRQVEALVATEAKLAFAHVRRGVLPDAHSHWTVPRIIGFARTAELFLTGRTLTGEEAAAMGLVSRALPAAEVLPAAMAIGYIHIGTITGKLNGVMPATTPSG